MTLRHALLFSGLVSAVGCAQIDGKTDEVIQSAGGTRGMDAGNAEGGTDDSAADSGDGEGADDSSTSVDGSLSLPGSDAGPAETDPGQPGPTTTPDAAIAPIVANGTCAAPFELTFSSNRVTAMGNTTGGSETLSPKCTPSGAGIVATGGPDHIYHFRMPFKGRVAVNTGATAPFAASAYLLTACGNATTEKACNYAGVLSYDANAGDDLFLYVDSGSKSAATPSAGAYAVALTLREESPIGGACGNGTTDPYCSAGLFCQDEGVGGVCRTGNPESCATAVPLTLRQTASGRVARVLGSTLGAKDDIVPDCPSLEAQGVEHVYSFKLTATSNVKISLQPTAGYDAVLAVLETACSNVAATLACVDSGNGGGAEAASGSLAAGTYYVVVDAFSRTVEPSGSYDLTVTATP